MPGAINDRVATAGRAVRLGSVIPGPVLGPGRRLADRPATNLNAEAAAGEVADWDVTVDRAPWLHDPGHRGRVRPPAGRLVRRRRAHHPVPARAVRDWAATVAPMRLGRVTRPGREDRRSSSAWPKERPGDPAALAARHAKALDDLAARFGEYPYPRLTIGVTTGLTGGIEFPTHIFLGSGVATIHLVHEVAHQWFYGLVGNDQFRDPWLDEGFATYAEARRRRRPGLPAGPGPPRRRPGPPRASRWAYWGGHGGSGYYLSVYIGGLQALGKLGDRLGGYGPLDCALRRYLRDRAYTVSRPADFLDAVTAQTGVDPAPVLAPVRGPLRASPAGRSTRVLDVGLMFTTVNQGGRRSEICGLCSCSVRCLLVRLGSAPALGYQNGRRDAEELSPTSRLIPGAVDRTRPAPEDDRPRRAGIVAQGSLLGSRLVLRPLVAQEAFQLGRQRVAARQVALVDLVVVALLELADVGARHRGRSRPAR